MTILNSPFGKIVLSIIFRLCDGGNKSSCSCTKFPFAPKIAGQSAKRVIIKTVALEELEYWAALEMACHAAASGQREQERKVSMGYDVSCTHF